MEIQPEKPYLHEDEDGMTKLHLSQVIGVYVEINYCVLHRMCLVSFSIFRCTLSVSSESGASSCDDADSDHHSWSSVYQATLGLNCKDKQRTVVKCKVGDNPELLLCSLVPGVQESCPLDLLFDQEVTFTVSGAGSVHLTGYYMPLEFDSEDEDDYDSEDEDGIEFSEGEGDEDSDGLEGVPSSGMHFVQGFCAFICNPLLTIIVFHSKPSFLKHSLIDIAYCS